MKKRLIAGSAIAALALSLGSTTGAVADDKFRDGKGISNILSRGKQEWFHFNKHARHSSKL